MAELFGGSPPRPPHWRRSALSAEQWEEVTRRYLDGTPAKVLAVEFQVTVAAVRHHVSPRRLS